MKAFGDENEATPDSAQVYFWDVNEATPDSARPNRHPSSRTDVSSKRTVEPDSTSNFFV